MHPRDCKWWEYKEHPQAATTLRLRCEKVLHELAEGKLNSEARLRNTRPIHEELFLGLTPVEQPYLAGHYRGEKFKCLRYLEVRILGDARVGVPPGRVDPEMANFTSQLLARGLKALDDAFAIPDATLSPAEKLNYVVKFACRLLVQFLRIHPFANGNGHIGRMIVWLLLARHGYWPREWPLDDHPPYDELLSRYRDGDEQPLEDFVHKAIDGTVAQSTPIPSNRSSGSNVTAVRAS